MAGASAEHYSIEEIEYLSVGGVSLTAKIFRPSGEGPFPALIECHGGGWCVGNRTNNDSINQAVAEHGIVVVAIDFRMPPQFTYPAALQDVNFATRWLKSHAARFHTRPDWVGAMGSSSGGHLITLSGMRPHDHHYIAHQCDTVIHDGTLAFAVALWPVICPLGRYHYLKSIPRSQAHPVLMEGIERHDAFWLSEKAMREGSPCYALEAGEHMALPEMLYIQNDQDNLHPRADMDRFVRAFAKAGGSIRAEMFSGSSYDFLRADPQSPESQRALKIVTDFIKNKTQRKRS